MMMVGRDDGRRVSGKGSESGDGNGNGDNPPTCNVSLFSFLNQNQCEHNLSDSDISTSIGWNEDTGSSTQDDGSKDSRVRKKGESRIKKSRRKWSNG